jgi:hypothetical protein
MNLDSLVIDRDDAKARLDEYRAQVAEERTAEDDAIAAGYRAAARGLPVIHLPDVIHAGGYFPNGFPRIAVARADATECYVRAWLQTGGDHASFLFTDREWDRGRARVGRHRVAVRTSGPTEWSGDRWRGRTIVPVIPPQHRPKRSRLWRFHVLWEVERWDPTPPVDPALLRHIRGDLWAVMATWDLTPLERAVLAARSSS